MTQNFQILQLYGRPALDAKDNGKRNDATEQRTCKRTGVGEQPCKTTGHALGDPVAQRSGKTQEQRCRDQERQRAGKDDAQIFGHMLVDEMENDGEDPHRQNNREDRTLVVIGGDIDRAKGITGDAFFRREEGGVHQDTGSHDAEDLLDLEPLCCCVADDERHKVEGCITHSIEHGDDIRLGRYQTDRSEQGDNALDHTACHNGIQAGRHTGCQCIQTPGNDVGLFLRHIIRGRLCLHSAACRHTGHCKELFVHLRHGGADDALDLTAGFHDLQNAADFTQFFHVYRITVDRNDAKPGDAVKCVLYIFASAHSLQNFCAELGVFGF